MGDSTVEGEETMSMSKVMAAMVAIGVISSGVMSAHAAGPEDTIKARQQGFKDIGKAFKAVRDQVQGGNPDLEVIKSSAALIQKSSGSVASWFPKGTGPEAGVKTTAKPEIWTDAAGFKTALDNFVDQAGKFQQVANAGDAAPLPAAVKALGQTCGGCHDKFRVKEN